MQELQVPQETQKSTKTSNSWSVKGRRVPYFHNDDHRRNVTEDSNQFAKIGNTFFYHK